MCYIWAFSPQTVLGFCTNMLTLAEVEMFHLLDGLGQFAGPLEPWWSMEESGSKLIFDCYFWNPQVNYRKIDFL